MLVFLVARDDAGAAVGCGGLRAIEPGLVEIKRMYVPPERRGTGVAPTLLAALEEAARAHGARRVVLETGPGQPEAIALYRRYGYCEIPCYGAYSGAPLSLCFERVL
jgi:ribosomal protein S18 acetylase RimI-like enzyme